MKLNDKERARYQRQMLINDWGEQGQEKLRSTSVFIAGAGGLGCPVALFLTIAGVGKLTICDSSEVYPTNLNRQTLYREWDIGKSKVYCAREALIEYNPQVDVVPLDKKVTEQTVEDFVGDSTIILDCLDNFTSRHILNQYSVKKSIPLIHAGIEGLSGQITFIHTPETPCLYCIFPSKIPSKDIFPVAGVTPGVIGILQACEAIKYIVGIGENLKGQLLVWDGALMQFDNIEIKKNPCCPVCNKKG